MKFNDDRYVRCDSGDFVHISEVLNAYMEDITVVHGPDATHIAPVPTGFQGIDNLLGGGMQRSDVIVIASRPSLGKSTLALNIARAAAVSGNCVGIFTFEMSRDQIGIRLLASETNVDSYRIRIGLLSTEEEERLLDAIRALSDLPIYIDDTPTQTIVDMRSKASRLQSDRGLDLLIIDYLQLIGSEGRIDNRAQELGDVMRTLKGMAREFDIPILACSQINRGVEDRPNRRPLLSDMRDSGSIEDDADVVAFIHREDVYITREDWEKSRPTEQYPQNIAEIIFAKHRNGPIGEMLLYFRSDLVRFESLETTPSMEYAPSEA